MTSGTGTGGGVAPILVAGFVCFALAHLGLVSAGVEPWASVTKPLPALTLAGYALASRRGGLLASAMAFCAAADVALDVENLFVVGVVLFGIAHVCLVVLLVQRGSRPRVPVVVAYLVVWAAVIWWLWPSLADLRVPLAGYSLLVTAMAVTSSGLDARTGLGGALFFVSDGLVAASIAGREFLPQQGLWVMATYYAALFLLVTGPARRGS